MEIAEEGGWGCSVCGGGQIAISRGKSARFLVAEKAAGPGYI
jgi:hypothetical protein